MSDEHRELDGDASRPSEGSRTDQHSVPSYAVAHASAPGAGMGSAPGYGSDAQRPGEGRHGSDGSATNPGPAAPPAAGPAWASEGAHSYGSYYGSGPNPPYQGQYPTAQLPQPPDQQPPGGGYGAQGGEQPRRQRGMAGIVTAAVLAGVIGGGLGFGGAYALIGNNGGSSPTLTSQGQSAGAVNAAPGTVAAAAQKASPSTVDIQLRVQGGTAEGSGVILTADGNVLTNNHVVEGAQGPITVTLNDGSEHQATVVGTSPSYDLAVIKLQNVSNLTPATLGQSSQLQVGQPVVAIGSPQGLTGTVTTGIVSAFNRTVATQSESGGPAVVYNGLQTDAPINHGNSGGPLVNLDGQVVGINSAIAGDNSTGLGFAIPVDQAKRVAEEIMKTGTATKPLLGVQGSTQDNSTDGAKLAVVQPGSPAANAGLATGDVVTKVGDAKVDDFADLVARIGSYAPGAQVPLTVSGSGGDKTVTVTLGSQPDNGATTSNGGQTQQTPNPFGGRGQGQGQGSNPFGGGGIFGGGN
jgi:putative serine protease PepD